MEQPVSLQINLSPGDYPHAKYILPHQLKTLAKQVDEIILTVETRPSKGHFAMGWNENKTLLDAFLQNEVIPRYNVKIIPVDYSASTKTHVADYFFGTGYMPEKDYRGGPFYAYFYGLYAAKNNIVLHLDSDMLLGGGSNTSIEEALHFFETDENCFTVSPLPGPPHPGGILINQPAHHKAGKYIYEFTGMSTRIFMLNKTWFDTKKLRFKKPGIKNQVKAILKGHPNAELPENLLSAYMVGHNLKRVDFLGSGNGLWSLHPPYRTKAFYDELPLLIKRVEGNNLPKSQQGFYDIVDEVCDWAEARGRLKAAHWWKRIFN